MSEEGFANRRLNLHYNSLNFDGVSKGNPGLVGLGGVIFYPGGNKQKDYAWGLGKRSNNGVEWFALLKGLEIANSCRMEEIEVYGDSLIVIKETIMLYKKIKNPRIKMNHILICLGREFKSIKVFHIPRTNNKQADLMANRGVLLDYGELVCNEKRKGISWIP